MISFFPTPYPDELIYSVLARYYVRSSDTSPKAALDDLFGSNSVIATFDLPSHLEVLVSNLPLLSPHTVDSFMKQHTLYPLYAPFLPPERALLVSSSMRNHFHGDIHTRVGIMAGAIPTNPHFRFCPVCLREEIEKYGEPYWHRLHQISGVEVCPVHCVMLQNSTVKISGDNRHEFYAADQDNCIIKPTIVDYSNGTFKKLLLLAEDVQILLNMVIKPKTGEWYRKQYQGFLTDKKLATASGRIFQKELLREFNDFYGTEFLSAVHSKIETDRENNWLSEIVRKHRKVFHPIRHLLLMRFLGQTVDSFFSGDSFSKPFGNGPWVCFNGASKHYLKKVIKSVSISYSHDAKKLIGTFSCRCGFIYSTSDISVPYGNKLRYGKITSFGKIWERNLEEMLATDKKSFRKTAKLLHVDTNTVIKHAKRLGLIAFNEKSDKETAIRLPEVSVRKRDIKREMWLDLRKNNPNADKTTLRGKKPGLYIWLYRHDRKWLNGNSPKKKRIAYANNRVNWSKRDEKILLFTQKAVACILEKNPPVRVNISAVGKMIGFRALLEKHLEKLPETKSFLKTRTETVEQFQIRRIFWAVNKLADEGKNIVSWKVVRLAGLRKETADRLYLHIERAIQKTTPKKLYWRKTG